MDLFSFEGGATPGKLIMGLKIIKCNQILPLGLNRVQVNPASDLGFGWALVRSVLKNFSLGDNFYKRIRMKFVLFIFSLFLSCLFVPDVSALF